MILFPKSAGHIISFYSHHYAVIPIVGLMVYDFFFVSIAIQHALRCIDFSVVRDGWRHFNYDLLLTPKDYKWFIQKPLNKLYPANPEMHAVYMDMKAEMDDRKEECKRQAGS